MLIRLSRWLEIDETLLPPIDLIIIGQGTLLNVAGKTRIEIFNGEKPKKYLTGHSILLLGISGDNNQVHDAV